MGFTLMASSAAAQTSETQIPVPLPIATPTDAAPTEWKICNQTSYVLRIANAYMRSGRVEASGWRGLNPGACLSEATPPESPRFLYAESAPVHQGDIREWAGNVELCAAEANFTSDAASECSKERLDEQSLTPRKFLAVDPAELQTDLIEKAENSSVGLKICNNSTARIWSAIATRHQGGWQSRGWWDVEAGTCAKPYNAPLDGTEAHIFALQEHTDEDGKALPDKHLRTVSTVPSQFCIAEAKFSALGREFCTENGYNIANFRPVSTDNDGTKITLTDTDFIDSNPEGLRR